MTEETVHDAVVLERRFEAPIDLVWAMWTEAGHFASWYGPQGATVSVAEMDVRLGGRRHIGMEMTTPDGPMRMWFVGEYREIDEPTRLVYTEALADEHGDELPADSPGATGWQMALDELADRLAG